MPQMSAMDWLILMMFFFFIYYLLFLMIYYYMYIKVNYKNLNLMKKLYIMIW
uniref:ATP synthase subunit 8 n=1 Tax=Asobara japonica TaxID=554476 RepID=A0A6B9XNS4_9HYME|nr:ATP synthase F0 subunit 8 [Asobara japonica]QHR84918.1 ATP synthase subunit 8 [Asobara japonica]